MDKKKIKEIVIDSISEIFTEAQREMPEIGDGTEPFGGICQFDSLTAIEVGVRIQERFDAALFKDDPLILFVSKEKKKSLTIKEIVDTIHELCSKQGE